MPIRVGIYDFFSYTIPGSLYLAAIVNLLASLQIVSIDFTTLNLSLTQIVIIAILSYIFGLIFDPLAYNLWYKIFRARNFFDKTLDGFKKNNPHFDISFKAHEVPILLAYVRQDNMDLAANIDKYNATKIMLRNIGFSFLLFAITLAVELLINKSMLQLLFLVSCLTASIISERSAVKYEKWHYLIIFETIVVRNWDMASFMRMRKSEVSTPT